MLKGGSGSVFGVGDKKSGEGVGFNEESWRVR